MPIPKAAGLQILRKGTDSEEVTYVKSSEKVPFRKVGDSARNDYEKGMPAAHTLFQVKSLALIANARKVGIHLQQR